MGRRPSRLPPAFDEDRSVSVAHVWERTVEAALDQGVHAVVLTGDLVDRDNRLFEAWGPLERGLTRLSEAGIETVAVAGNHDHDVLPGLFRRLDLPRVRLLGAGGEWASISLELGGTPVRFLGFSFPRERVPRSPLEEAPREEGREPLAFGVVHGELDTPASPYAPLDRRALAAFPVHAWLLGHIHAPRFEAGSSGAPALLYPGSPQPLDPGEPGAHGPWLLHAAPGGAPEAQQLPMATVRYEPIELAVGADEAVEDVRLALPQRLRAAIAGETQGLRCLAARVAIRDAGNRPGELDRALAGDIADLDVPIGEGSLVVEKLAVETEPAIELETLARGEDAAGELARLIRALDGEATADDPDALWSEVRSALRAVSDHPAFAELETQSESDEALEARLRRLALDLLSALRAQKEAS